MTAVRAIWRKKWPFFAETNFFAHLGTPITHYVIEKAEGASTSWTLCGKVNGDQNKCHITGLRPEKDHRLQVTLTRSLRHSLP